jgi:hypothetical protein
MFRKPRREESKPYRDWIATLICCIPECKTNYPPTEAHHWNRRGDSGMGTKCSDFRCLPLCNGHHREFHDHGRNTFMEKYGITPGAIEIKIEAYNRIWRRLNADRT